MGAAAAVGLIFEAGALVPCSSADVLGLEAAACVCIAARWRAKICAAALVAALAVAEAAAFLLVLAFFCAVAVVAPVAASTWGATGAASS